MCVYKGFFGPKGSSVHLWIILVPSGRSVSKFKLENYIPATRKHQSKACLHILLWRPALLEVSLSSPWARYPSGGSWPEPRGAGGILCLGGRHLTCSENLVLGLQLLTAELCTVVFQCRLLFPQEWGRDYSFNTGLEIRLKPGSQRNKASTLFKTSLTLFPHAILLQHEHCGWSLQFLSKTRPNPAMWWRNVNLFWCWEPKSRGWKSTSRFTVLFLIHLKVLITSGTKSSPVACLDREHLGKKTLICTVAGAGWRAQLTCSNPSALQMAALELLVGARGSRWPNYQQALIPQSHRYSNDLIAWSLTFVLKTQILYKYKAADSLQKLSASQNNAIAQ